MSKIIVCACGGGAINAADFIREELASLPGDFCKPVYTCIDTTDKTISHYPKLKNNFVKIVSTRQDMGEIDGVSGERKNIQIVKEIEKNVKNYVDSLSISNGDFYFLISSISGGSGSTISPILYKVLRERDVTVVPIVIADTSNYLYAVNSINTLISFNNIARKTKTAGAIAYFNNTVNYSTTPMSEMAVNKEIAKLLKYFSMFVSGNIGDIDSADMRNFFIPSRYKSFSVEPGLYTISGKITKLEDPHAIIARTVITESDDDLNIAIPLLHNKIGVASIQHNEVLGDKSFPVFLYLQREVINTIFNELNNNKKRLDEVNNVSSNDLNALADSIDDDDSGLML